MIYRITDKAADKVFKALQDITEGPQSNRAITSYIVIHNGIAYATNGMIIYRTKATADKGKAIENGFYFYDRGYLNGLEADDPFYCKNCDFNKKNTPENMVAMMEKCIFKTDKADIKKARIDFTGSKKQEEAAIIFFQALAQFTESLFMPSVYKPIVPILEGTYEIYTLGKESPLQIRNNACVIIIMPVSIELIKGF